MTPITLATIAAKQAGEVIRNHFRGSFTIGTKKNFRDLLTSADLSSEKVILKAIHEYFPDHAILSEETRKDKLLSERLWIVDPIDGTTNFAAGLPLCCVSIAYAEKGVVRAGVVYNPITQELFSGERDSGAWLNEKIKLAVKHTSTLHSALVSYDYSSVDDYRKEVVKITQNLPFHVRGVRVIGAAAIEFAYVAAGFLDAYLSRGSHPWDVAAGGLLVEEAGGKVTDWNGESWKLDCGNFLATNGYIHEEFIKEIIHEKK